MIFRASSLCALGGLILSGWAAAAEVGPFFEPAQPFFQSQVEVTAPLRNTPAGAGPVNFVVRGILLPLGSEHCVLFDQELLRVAAIWAVPAGEPLVTLKTMPQISYADARKKAGTEHPRPTGPLLLETGMLPGVSADGVGGLGSDPRAPSAYPDAGRGPLPAGRARFEGVELRGGVAVLHYRVGGTAVREWHESRSRRGATVLLRHFEIEPHAQPLHVAVGASTGGEWRLASARTAQGGAGDGGALVATVNLEEAAFALEGGALVLVLPGSPRVQRVSVAVAIGAANPPTVREPTPAMPARTRARRWPETAAAPTQLAAMERNGLILDRIATPDDNPWRRRVRVADLAFLTDDRAAVVTYDGDVWLVDGFDAPSFRELRWRRFASGLHEPLAIVRTAEGEIRVSTKNGVVRLEDRDGNGEADWCGNFSDLMLQSQTTRSFPLDMALGPDGSTYVSQGGIVNRSGMGAGGEGTAHTGGIVRIAPDGRAAELFAGGMREPFVTVHPGNGVVTATDQQGHFIPSSVAYLVRRGDSFGFPQATPARLTPPLVWIPHEHDTSSSSQAWMLGEGLGPWNGKLLHLSYGTGRLFLVSPDLEAPTPQGAVIPLEWRTDLPLLHARMNLRGDAMYLAGFQIWGTRAGTPWALGRLRRGDTPITTALAARSVADGVVLEFAEPVSAESLRPENVRVRAWNYRRSSAYGSGRYTMEGSAGTTPWGVAQVVRSRDGASVFIHLPQLAAADQVEVRHDFALASGAQAGGVVYFTVHEPRKVELTELGFPAIDLSRAPVASVAESEPPATAAAGRQIAESLGCLVCHSVDGTTDGKVGPTWKGLFGSTRRFVDGTSEFADESYLREKILDPQQRKLKPGTVEMPSYRGVLTDQQLDSLVLYIRSLGRRFD